MPELPELNTFTRAYITTALWSTSDESDPSGGVPLDRNYSIEDIAPETLATMVEDCARFQTENNETLLALAECIDQVRLSNDTADLPPLSRLASHAGHDFWLNRNGHGAGFWDGDYPEPHASALDKAASAFGNVDLYVGDDGKIYAM